jgi:hypothetical protein
MSDIDMHYLDILEQKFLLLFEGKSHCVWYLAVSIAVMSNAAINISVWVPIL